MKNLLTKLLIIVFLFTGIIKIFAQTLLFEETFPDLNLGDRGWYGGVGDPGYNLVYDTVLQKNVIYEEWTAAGSGTGNTDPAFPDGVSSALRMQFTPSEEITVHAAFKYSNYIEHAGNSHHHQIGRGYVTWTAPNDGRTTYLEASRAGMGFPVVISNGETWVGPAWAQSAMEAMGYTDIQNPPYNNFPSASRSFILKWREPLVAHADMDNLDWVVDDQWYEVVLNIKSSSTDAKVVLLAREIGATNWITISNESGFNMGDRDDLFNQYLIGSYLHDNRQEGARAYTGWIKVYQGDAVDNILNPITTSSYYIDPINGSDDNPGTLADPWETFKNISTYYSSAYKPAGWQELQPGDTIYLMDGVHNTIMNPGDSGGPTGGGSYIAHFRTKHGDADNWFNIKAYPGANPILDPQGTGVGIRIYQSSYWDVSGITIRNAYTETEGGGITLSEISNVKIHEVEVYDTDGFRYNNIAGLHCTGCYNMEIYNSSFYDNYDRVTEPIGGANGSNIKIFTGGNISIYDNQIYNTAPITAEKTAAGIVYKHASSDPNAYFNVYNNTFKNLKQVAFQSGTANTHFHHNIIIDSDGISSRDWGGPTHQINQIFEYNTIYSSIYSLNYRTSGFLVNPTTAWQNSDFPDAPKDIVIRNNIIYDIRNSYAGENGVIDIGTYMSDDLYNEIYPELTIESNCYYNPNIPVQLNIGAANGGNYGALGDMYSLSQWQQNLGFDINGVEANPMFVNISESDFQLLAGSPCSNMGAYPNQTDTESPTATCQDITIQLDNTGNVTIVASDIDNGSTDNIEIASTTIDISTFDCSNIGENTVTLTVTDTSGNITSCTAVVTIEDNTEPIINCPEDLTVFVNNTNSYTVPDYFLTGEVSVTDNCTNPVTNTNQNPPSGTVLNEGNTYTVYFTTEDQSSNTNTCSFELTVEPFLGTSDNFLNSIFIIPNPTYNTFTISLQDETLKKVIIYNQLGQKVKEVSYNKVNISTFANGVYFIKIISESGKTAIKKVIKN